MSLQDTQKKFPNIGKAEVIQTIRKVDVIQNIKNAEVIKTLKKLR